MNMSFNEIKEYFSDSFRLGLEASKANVTLDNDHEFTKLFASCTNLNVRLRMVEAWYAGNDMTWRDVEELGE